MRESKKKILRQIVNLLIGSLVLIGICILPMLKLIGVTTMSWIDVLIPLFFFIGFNLVWLVGYFSYWLALPGTKD